MKTILDFFSIRDKDYIIYMNPSQGEGFFGVVFLHLNEGQRMSYSEQIVKPTEAP